MAIIKPLFLVLLDEKLKIYLIYTFAPSPPNIVKYPSISFHPNYLKDSITAHLP